MNFEQMFDKYWEFAEKTFDTKSHEATKGLIREAKELDFEFNKEWDDPEFEIKSLIEITDVLFYTIYILKRQGFTYEQLIPVMNKKLEILKTREWIKDETGCYSHKK